VVHLTSHEGLTADHVSTDVKSVLRLMGDYAGACDVKKVSSNRHRRKKQKPRIAPRPLLSKGRLLSRERPPSKECQYLAPLFGAAMLSAPEPALS
jgi:hypothetical protein